MRFYNTLRSPNLILTIQFYCEISWKIVIFRLKQLYFNKYLINNNERQTEIVAHYKMFFFLQ